MCCPPSTLIVNITCQKKLSSCKIFETSFQCNLLFIFQHHKFVFKLQYIIYLIFTISILNVTFRDLLKVSVLLRECYFEKKQMRKSDP